MDICYCQRQVEYAKCCQPIHSDPTNAQTPEQLMRARYSAHVLGLVDFVINTYHSSCHADLQREAIADSINSQWTGLEIIRTWLGSDPNEGFVHFKAFFVDQQQTLCLEEQSRFVRENQQWFYIDGTFPKHNKVGRNEPCLCGSGKKFKQCCG
ncbi:YchJ family protein [Vibrio metschnikovii]|uniref:YchJ family protein n=1 Tax=Vibrio metschnikovii TaxID=28172 RepID=UPI001C30EBFC|nr:YchJ family protein [Vibrio metschnikovii]